MRPLICGLLLALSGPQLVSATTYTVDQGGRGDCTTINACIARAGSGDTILINPGTYEESLGNTPGNGYPYCSGSNPCSDSTIPSGTPDHPTVIKAASSRTVTLRPPNRNGFYNIIWLGGVQWVTIDGLVTDSVNQTSYGQDVEARSTGAGPVGHITIQNMEITRSGNSGVSGVCGVGLTMSYDSSDYVIRNNKIHDLGGVFGDGCYAIYYHASNGIVENNEMYNLNSYGFHFYNNKGSAPGGDNSNNVIRNNHIHDVGAACMLIASAGSGNLVYNNVLERCGSTQHAYASGPRGGIEVGCYGPTVGLQLYNNTIVGNTGPGIRNCAPGSVIRNNILWGNSGGAITNEGDMSADHNLIDQDPLFTNQGAGDFTLQPGSPAKGAGVPMPDIVGTPPDQGATPGAGAQRPRPVPRNLRALLR